MKTNSELMKACVRELGGATDTVFEAIRYAGVDRPGVDPEGWCIHTPGRGAFVIVPGGERQAREVVRLLNEAFGRGDAVSHEDVVLACVDGSRNHDNELIVRCRRCGFIRRPSSDESVTIGGQ